MTNKQMLQTILEMQRHLVVDLFALLVLGVQIRDGETGEIEPSPKTWEKVVRLGGACEQFAEQYRRVN